MKKVAMVYLAGGMHSDWRARVIEACPAYAFRDPSSHGLTDEEAYTEWDLRAIRDSQIVLAYIDSANPSGYGMSVEVGYARGLGRDIYYVCEDDTERQKYFGMVRSCANVTFTSLQDAINALNGMVPA